MTNLNDTSPHGTSPYGISQDTWDALYDAALAVQPNAHAPYSKFFVGAALLTESGEIIVGCNMENATYGATVCAERTAFGNAITRGFREFKALCVITDLTPPAAPCGICRQVIAEFCKDLPIFVANLQKEGYYSSLGELLPKQFTEF